MKLTQEQHMEIKTAKTLDHKVQIAKDIAATQIIPPPVPKDDGKEPGDDFGGR